MTIIGDTRRQCDYIIAGFPKSGNNWIKMILSSVITKKCLTYTQSSELIDSPETGLNMVRTHAIYNDTFYFKKLVYVIRDPRAVASSTLRHFDDHIKLYRKKYLNLNAEKIMGLWSPGRQFNIEWNHHVISYLEVAEKDNRILIVRYKDLYDEPIKWFQNICKHFDLEVTDNELQTYIDWYKSEDFIKISGLPSEFKWKFKKDSWKEDLSQQLILDIEERYKDVMDIMGYTKEG